MNFVIKSWKFYFRSAGMLITASWASMLSVALFTVNKGTESLCNLHRRNFLPNCYTSCICQVTQAARMTTFVLLLARAEYVLKSKFHAIWSQEFSYLCSLPTSNSTLYNIPWIVLIRPRIDSPKISSAISNHILCARPLSAAATSLPSNNLKEDPGVHTFRVIVRQRRSTSVARMIRMPRMNMSDFDVHPRGPSISASATSINFSRPPVTHFESAAACSTESARFDRRLRT